MGVILFDGIAPEDEIIGWLICFGFPLVGTSLMVVVAAFTYSRYLLRKKIEAASARVLEAHPELAQSTEDFRVFARKVLRELGWDRVSFTFS